MMDRLAEFHPAFREFLDAQVRIDHERQERRRYRDPDTNKFAYTQSEWTPIYVNDFIMEALPQTLSNEDLKMDRWPAPIYVFRFPSGRKLVSKIQATREFLGQNVTVDFMTVVEQKRDGTEVPLPEYNWAVEEINGFTPKTDRRGIGGRGRRGELELMEPETLNSPADRSEEEGVGTGTGATAGAANDPGRGSRPGTGGIIGRGGNTPGGNNPTGKNQFNKGE
jgi:hypothetical protein